MAVLSGKLFACGGASFDFAFSSVEVYDYKRDRWSRAANMKKSRAFLDVVSLSGYLYALGGAEMENGQVSGRLESIERYCPCTNQWTLLVKPYFPFWGIRATMHQSRDGKNIVFVVGQHADQALYSGTLGELTFCEGKFTNMSIVASQNSRVQAGLAILP